MRDMPRVEKDGPTDKERPSVLYGLVMGFLLGVVLAVITGGITADWVRQRKNLELSELRGQNAALRQELKDYEVNRQAWQQAASKAIKAAGQDCQDCTPGDLRVALEKIVH
jgi:hypothetical protein